jgi:hypothetical protein
MRKLPRRARLHEPNQYFPRSAYRSFLDPAASAAQQVKTSDYEVGPSAKDVSVLRIDHCSIEGQLFGVWQAFSGRGVLDFKEKMNALLASRNTQLSCGDRLSVLRPALS